MRLLACFFMCALLLSCQNSMEPKEPFKSLLKNCDQVDIVFYNGGDSLHYQTKDSAGIRIFAQLISGKAGLAKDTCTPMGELRYLRDSSTVLLSAPFSLPDSALRTRCDYVTYTYQNSLYKHALTEKAKRLLQQIRSAQKDTAQRVK